MKSNYFVNLPRSFQSRGDAFTWECTLESRASALGSMEAFLVHCPDLLTESVLKRVVDSVETTLATMNIVSELLRLHGQRLRQAIHTLRIRLYALLTRLPFKHYEHVFNSLLRELVADITLSDNVHSTTAGSQLAEMCSAVEDCLLGGWLRNSSHAELEIQVS